MQPLNFNKPISTPMHKAVRMWTICSTFVLLSVCLACAIRSLHQWQTYQELKAHHVRMAGTTQHTMQLQNLALKQHQERELLQKKLVATQTNQQQAQHIIDLLKTISGSTKHNTTLESMTIHKEQFEFKVVGTSTTSLTQLARELKKHAAYQNITITAFEYKDANRMVGIFSSKKI